MTTTLSAASITEEGTRRVVEIDGVKVNYHEVGSGEPLLVIHSWGPSPGVTTWMSMHKVLGALGENHRVIAMDMPNYGRTGPIIYNEPVHSVIARTAVQLLDHLGITAPISAIGTSQGATSCLVLALLYPGRVKNLVLGSCHASTGGDPYLLSPFPSEAGRAMRAYNADMSRANLRRVFESLIHDDALITDELLAELEAVRDGAPDHVEASQKSVTVQHSNLSQLNEITVPTLIIHGRFDRMVPCEQGLMLLNYIPSSDLVVLNNCGHWPPFEQPDEWASHVLAFLARVED
jgi:pimeloyl-ACP methyl ester carboxylesterase